MRIFLTGATGFIGAHILPELLAAGHEVLGLTRSGAGAQRLSAAGAEAHRGTLEDLGSLRDGAAQCDAIIHTAFDHDFAHYVENCEKDRRVIETLGSVLLGSDRPLLITSAVGIGTPADGGPAIESVFDSAHPLPRIASEQAGNALLDAGVDVRVVRLPQVHDKERQGLISPYIDLARAKGVVAYAGEGANRWSAAHVRDVARLYVLALDRGRAGERYHAVAEEGVPMRDIARTIATGLDLPLVSLSPAEVSAHFGWMAAFVGRDMRAAAEWTRARLEWLPTGPDLLADLAAMDDAAAP